MAWAMHNLSMMHNTVTVSIEAALTAWVLVLHKAAVVEYLEYK